MESKEACNKPFINEDLTAFDKVADGRLYLSEIEEDQLDCLVQHLIHTKDQDIRDQFLSMVKNDLWEAIRSKLMELQSKDDLPADVKERIDHLLSIDYSDSKFIYTADVKYSFGALKLSAEQGGMGYYYSLLRHGIITDGIVDSRFVVNDWALTASAKLSAENYWTTEDESYTDGMPSQHLSDSYWGLEGALMFGALKRDESINLSAFIDGAYFHKPPPGMLGSVLATGGSVFFKEIGKSPFSANATVNYEKSDKIPMNPELLDPEEESLVVDAETSLMFKKAGLLLTYQHEYIDSIKPMIAEETNSDSGSLLSHIAFKGGFIRLGAGGGYWKEKGELISGESDSSNGSEMHGDVQLTLNPVQPLNIILSGSIYANHADGTFIGWFPSGEGALDVTLAVKDVYFMLGGEIEGFHRDLNLYQEMIKYSVYGGIAYSPVDYFNTGVKVRYSDIDQDGYEKYDESSWNGIAAVNYRIIKNPDLWVKYEGLIEKVDHKSSEDKMDQLMAMLTASLVLKY